MNQHAIHSCWVDANGNSGSVGDPHAVFSWWSFSKTLIAICTLKLAESGQLALDETIPGRPYSIRQLLQHQAGVPDYGQLAAYHQAVANGEPAWPTEKLFELTNPEQLLFSPGHGWAYSNIGYLMVRELIEQKTGLGLSELVEQFICSPLKLRNVRLAEKSGDIAEHYDPAWVYHGCFIGPPAAAAKILAALFAGQLLNPESLIGMMINHLLGDELPGRPWSSHGYGLGLMIGEMGNAGRVCGHSGGGPQSVNAVYYFENLDQPICIASFTTAPDEGVAEYEVRRIALLCQE